MQDKPNRVDWAEKNLTRQIDWIGKFDVKANLLIAIYMAMLSYLFSVLPRLHLFNTGLTISTVLTIGLLSIGIACLFRALVPNVKISEGGPSSFIFFGTIPLKPAEQFVKSFSELNEDTYLTDLLWQVYRNAQILGQKFSNLKTAYIFLAIATVPWLFSIYSAKQVAAQ